MGNQYGYGLAITYDDVTPKSVDHILRLLDMAPAYKEEAICWVMENIDLYHVTEISQLTVKQFLALLTKAHDSCCGTIAPIMADVIAEAEGIHLDALSDKEGAEFLVIQPFFPWEFPEWAKGLTKERIQSVLDKYLAVITDDIFIVCDIREM